MTRNVIAVRPDTPLKDVARLLVKHRIGGVPVVDDDNVVLGVVSESDFAIKELSSDHVHQSKLDRLLGRPNRDAERVAATTAAEAMARPAITIDDPAGSVRDAATVMVERNINRLPVTESGRLVGILTRGDLVRMFAEPDDAIRDRLRHQLRAVDGLTVDRVEDGVATLSGIVGTKTVAEAAIHIAEKVDGVVAVAWNGLGWRES
ncbi:MAG TPA: CBS domain-containing protein [Candidatus Limnocylindrales bacterium]|nr:CBS domain-containing protein [Candidatus Limnocylindrales bacterium]